MMNESINIIARAVIRHEGYILVSRPNEKNYRFSRDTVFLPGGHVNYGEFAIDGLKRELSEEIENSEEIVILGPLGILECHWDDKGKAYHEVDFVFEAQIKNAQLNKVPKSLVSYIDFEWVCYEDILSGREKILPSSFAEAIGEWEKIRIDSRCSMIRREE